MTKGGFKKKALQLEGARIEGVDCVTLMFNFPHPFCHTNPLFATQILYLLFELEKIHIPMGVSCVFFKYYYFKVDNLKI